MTTPLRKILPTLLLLATLACPAQMLAQGTGSIEGYVSNMSTGLPIGRAKVTLSPAFQEVLTDDQGYYRFTDVPVGKTQIDVSYLGFEKQTASITVEAGATASRDFALLLEQAGPRPKKDEEVLVLEKFSVVADQTMTAQALAMNEQRHAANIRNVVAFEELGEQGQENIGNYMRFLPGVVIMEGGAEGPGSVSLGGFPADMSNVQLDGANVASSGVGATTTRTLSLQDVPMGNIERIEVSKVPTPDMPASGLGGSINLVTRNSLGARRPSFNYQMYMNFNVNDGLTFSGGPKQATAATSPKYMQPSFNANFTYPVNKWIAFNVGASRTWSRYSTDNTPTENANWRTLVFINGPDGPVPVTASLYQSLWTQYALLNTTENLQAGVDFKVSRNDTLTFKIQRRDTTSKTAGYNFVGRYGKSTGDAHYVQSEAAKGGYDMNTRNNIESNTRTTEMIAKYRHVGPKWRIGADAAYATVSRLRSNKDKGYFQQVTTKIQNTNIRAEGLNTGDSVIPATFYVTNVAGRPLPIDPYDVNNYAWTGANNTHGLFKTEEASGRLDLERVFGSHFSIKTGGAYNRLEKDDRRSDDNYTLTKDAPATIISDYGLADGSIGVKMNGKNVNWVNPIKAYEVFLDHPEWFTLNDTAIQYTAQNSKRMVEAITAGYLRFDLKLFRNRMNITAGARYEKTDLDGWSIKHDKFAIYKRDANGNLTRDINGALELITTSNTEQYKLMYKERALHESQSYDGIYPSVNINYSITENLVVRGAYARTIGRPDVKYIVAGMSVPNVTDELDDTGYHSIVMGNPGLKPWTADSMHLSFDSYHIKGGFGSIGVYRKYVTNFFDWRSVRATRETLDALGIPDSDIEIMMANDFRIRRYENIGDANLTGFEFSYRQDLLFLPSWLQKMQLWLNYTHLKVAGPNAEDFIGFSPNVFSCGINFIRPRYSIRLTCAYQGETKSSRDDVLGTSTMDVYQLHTYSYQGAYTKYGITAEYALAKEFALYVNCDNIFARDRYNYRRGPIVIDYTTRSVRMQLSPFIMVGIKGSF